ncbi:MAG: DUF4157 domain-containing protein, partial [Coleofasciculus sp. S288]|nr:DUF4157 domain-containing protein [Coleofasciculus sp. S288]
TLFPNATQVFAQGAFHTALRNTGAGRPLPSSTRGSMERALGKDLSRVRLQTDSQAADAARELNAKAFTTGQTIYFGAGQYQPHTNQGKHLLAHELTHTIQQGSGGTRGQGSVQPSTLHPTHSSISQPHDRLEREAEAVADRILLGESVSLGAFSTATPDTQKIARQEAGETPPAPPPPTPAGSTPTDIPTGVPTDEISLATATFTPTPAVAAYLEAQPRNRGDVRVRLGNLAQGVIPVRKSGEGYATSEHEPIPLTHPVLQPLRDAGVNPVVAVRIQNSVIEGYVTVANRRGAVGNPRALVESIKDHSREMGWLGINVNRMPAPTNELREGILRLQVNDFPVTVGGYINGTGTFGLENETVTFRISATVRVPQLTESQLTIRRDPQGTLSGQGEIPVNIANFSGNLLAQYVNGTVDIRGTVGYQAEKFSGEVTLLVTDRETARNVAANQLGPEAIAQSVQDAAGGGEAGGEPRPGPRAVAGFGTLNFAFTEWMTGRAQVIIDNEGHITVVGEIAPPAEIELFPQRDYIYDLFTVEVRTLYGVPLVGNVFLFANIGMQALAKLGPGKIYNIVVQGTYSTDPNVLQNYSLQASLNISAFAGLRLRGEGGVGVELLGHDIKAGVGINALAGIRGYVEATPTIGYRETADPQEGRQGEYFIHGHMELAAQPFLGLSGDLFVELDSPWWSPAPDETWTWPMGQLEYPLPGEFGIGADVDYVIGSGELPEIQMGEVNFDSSKFMTDLLNDHVPPRQSTDQEHQGEWQEDETTGGTAEPTTTSQGTAPTTEPAQGQQQPGEGEVPAPNVMQRWGQGMQAVGELAQRSQRDPFTRAEIDAELERIKQQYGFNVLRAEPIGEDWGIVAEMNPTKRRNDPPKVEGESTQAEETTGEDTDQFGVGRSEIERRFRHRMDETYVFVLFNETWNVRRGRGTASGAGSKQQVRLISRGQGSYSLEEVETSEEADARQAHEEILRRRPAYVPYLKGHGDYTAGHADQNFLPAERDAVDEIGYRTGDHSNPSIKHPGTTGIDSATQSGKAGKPNWIPDHQPPDTLEEGGASLTYRFYPHSQQSARTQGGMVRVYKMWMQEIRQRGEDDWSKGVKSEWFW